MSEKRFKLSDWCGEQNVSNVIDIEKQTHLINVEVVDLLNEQQATIIHLEKVNGKNFAKRRLLEKDNLVLRNENEQLKQEIIIYKKAFQEQVQRCTL